MFNKRFAPAFFNEICTCNKEIDDLNNICSRGKGINVFNKRFAPVVIRLMIFIRDLLL